MRGSWDGGSRGISRIYYIGYLEILCVGMYIEFKMQQLLTVAMYTVAVDWYWLTRRLSGKLLATADHLLQLLQSGEFGLLTTEGMLQQPELPPLGDRGGRVVAV